MWTRVCRLWLVLLAVLPTSRSYDDLDRLVDQFLALNPETRQLLRTVVSAGVSLPRRQRRFIDLPSLGSLGSLGSGSTLLGPGADDDTVAQAASLVQRLNQMDRLQCVPRLLCSAAAGMLEPSPPSTPAPSVIRPPAPGVIRPPAPGVVRPPAPGVVRPPAPPTSAGGGARPPAPPPRFGQQRPFDVFNPAAPAGRAERRRGQRRRAPLGPPTRPRRHRSTQSHSARPATAAHHRQKRFTQTVNSFLSVLDGMARPYSFYPYSHALLMGGMTESRERCAQLYRRCPTDRDGFINVFNNMNRYFPGGVQALMPDFLPKFEMPALDAFLPGGR